MTESLERSKTIENALTGIVKRSWLNVINQVAGEQRNAQAWSSYWNKIPQDVINNSNLNYVIYASNNGNIDKLNSSLDNKLAGWNPNSTTKGISVDINNDYFFNTQSNNKIAKRTKSGGYIESGTTSGNNAHHVTYAADNFLYVSTDVPSIEKWDPISITKVKENTDLYVKNAKYEANTNASNIDNIDGLTLDRTALSNSYNLPCLSYAHDGPKVANGTTLFGLPTGINSEYGSNTKTKTGHHGVLRVRDNDTYDFRIISDYGCALFIDNNNNGVIDYDRDSDNNGIDKTDAVCATFGNYNTTATGSVSLSPGEYDFFVAYTKSSDLEHLQVQYKKQSENQYRNIPVFSGSFGYLNYDPDGTLYAQNPYGIFKWDAVNMICQEAQPIVSENAKQMRGGLALDSSNIYTLSFSPNKGAGKGVVKLDKTSLIVQANNDGPNDNFIIERPENSTMHFDVDDNIIFGAAHASSGTEGVLVKTRPSDLATLVLTGSNERNDVPNHPNKVSITPDGYIFSGFDGETSTVIRKYNSDLTPVLSSGSYVEYDIGTPCTGLVYDVE